MSTVDKLSKMYEHGRVQSHLGRVVILGCRNTVDADVMQAPFKKYNPAVTVSTARRARLFNCIIVLGSPVFDLETRSWVHHPDDYYELFVVLESDLPMYHDHGLKCSTTECENTPWVATNFRSYKDAVFQMINSTPVGSCPTIIHAIPYNWAVAGCNINGIITSARNFFMQIKPTSFRRLPLGISSHSENLRRASKKWSKRFDSKRHTDECHRKIKEARKSNAVDLLYGHIPDTDACSLMLEYAGLEALVEASRNAESRRRCMISHLACPKRRKLY
jgi:hypothetical protein